MIATHNPGKLTEMRDLLAPYGIARFRLATSAERTRRTADVSGQCTAQGRCGGAGPQGFPAFADDSGLVVDALAGSPDLFRTMAVPSKDFNSAMTRSSALLQERARRSRRNAVRISSRRFASPGRTAIARSRRAADGTLVWPPRGSGGLRLRSVFQPDCHTRTFAR